jgi:hypothetical protein
MGRRSSHRQMFPDDVRPPRRSRVHEQTPQHDGAHAAADLEPPEGRQSWVTATEGHQFVTTCGHYRCLPDRACLERRILVTGRGPPNAKLSDSEAFIELRPNGRRP